MKLCQNCNIEKKINEFPKKYNSCKKCRYKKTKCIHNKVKNRCIECGGKSICIHKKRKDSCKLCKGSQICAHDKFKNQCKQCNPNFKKIYKKCIHNKRKSRCVECRGSQVCSHKKSKYSCRICNPNKNFKPKKCIHNKRFCRCSICGGGELCIHKKIKSQCKICDLPGYLRILVSSRIRDAVQKNKKRNSVYYLDCTIKNYIKYLENKFKPDMSWDNFGKLWQIDHIIPIKYRENNIMPSLEVQLKRLHYTNTQPLYKKDNLSKGNRYCG